MYKHILICIIIIIFIILINYFTQNYTKESISKINEKLNTLKNDILNNKKISKDRVENIIREWNNRYEFLAFYLEHNELEKVKTELVSLEANIEMNNLEQAAADINRAIFLLEHIKQKTALQIKNIF